jgi:four helix bundle protein
MKKNILLEKSYAFSVRVVNLSKYLSAQKGEVMMSRQVFITGTSICSYVEEAQMATGREDFDRLLSIATKFAFKTNYWLRLLHDTEFLGDNQFDSLLSNCVELQKLLVSIRKKTRGRSAQNGPELE